MAGWDDTPPGKDKDAQASHFAFNQFSAAFATDADFKEFCAVIRMQKQQAGGDGESDTCMPACYPWRGAAPPQRGGVRTRGGLSMMPALDPQWTHSSRWVGMRTRLARSRRTRCEQSSRILASRLTLRCATQRAARDTLRLTVAL